jgi:hypothetical protein
LLLPILLAVPALPDSQKEKDAAAQHLRDVATIDRLTKENTSNAAAISKLGSENKKRAVSASQQSDAHAAETQQVVQDAASATQATVDTLTSKVAAIPTSIPPYDYRPVWLAAIPATVAMFAGVVSIVLALISRTTLNKVHALSNSAMTAALQSIAEARRSNATSLKALFKSEPTEDNRIKMETGERIAVEAEQKFGIHMQTQNALNATPS